MTDSFPLLDALTDRERDVLQLMAEGLSDRLIADKLVLSVETVRWYNRQIYSKLGVNSRTQATIRARELALFGQGVQSIEIPASTVHLPGYSTRFIGRATELHDIQQMLQDDTVRVISVVGAGGAGKTRLCVEAARAGAAKFTDGVYFIPPGSAIGDSLIDVVCRNLPAPVDWNQPGAWLMSYLEHRQLLLVLDSFEQFSGQTAILAQLLRVAPRLKILASSQITLNLNNEWVCRIDGLSAASTGDRTSVALSDAAAMLAACVQRVRRTFSVDENLACINEICQLVDGNPLAIELTASWLKTLNCQDVASEIRRNIDFLATTAPDIEDRHRSLRATFNYAWGMLTPDEQRMLKRLAVFRGEFGSDAAAQVSGMPIQILSSLVDRSLIQPTAAGRYELHHLLRQYAEEHLIASPASQTSRLAYALTLVLNGHLDNLTTFRQNSSLEDEDALLFDRSFSLAAFGIFAAASGDYERGIQCCSASLAYPGQAIQILLAHLGLAMAYCGLNRYGEARKHILHLLEQAIRLQSEVFMTLCLPVAALLTAHQAEPQRAFSLIALALDHRAWLPQWMQNWSVFRRLQQELEQEPGLDLSRDALVTGQSLDLSRTIQTLFAELKFSRHTPSPDSSHTP